VTVVAGLALDDLLALRNLDREAVGSRFGGARTIEDVGYEGLEGIDRLDPEDLRAHFFFRGDEQVMLYVPSDALQDTHPQALEAALGEPAARLRSRTGDRSEQYVYPDRGVAFATDGDVVEILEVFEPMPLERYKREIYREPPEFIR
jgi:hypothetical protein